jgi:beta-glucosidase
MSEQQSLDDFIWGAATASYQIEGATTTDGRGESIWDRFSHTPGKVHDGDTGDVACDHYNRYREDVALMAELGLDAYRFSVSWPRVMPEGRGRVNDKGLDFYDRLVDELLARGIAPFVTLYHWDLPQALEDAGGWPVRATASAFAEYASVVAHRLGDRVRHIATLNEPHIVSDLGYRQGVHAPGRREPEAALAAAHHLLVAHAWGVQAIRSAAPQVAAGIVLNFEAQQPSSAHMLDLEAAAVAHDHYNRWYIDPICGRDYPEGGAAAWGWGRAEVLEGDMPLIAGRIDWLGVNYYTRNLIRSPYLLPEEDTASAEGERTDMGWEVYPEGLKHVLHFVASRTESLPLYITENGVAYAPDPQSPTRDPKRVDYLDKHIRIALDARERGVPLKGYFVWSLLDNFEWAHGYSCRFGIVHVDYQTQERRIRDSGRFFASMAKEGLSR